jgi:hypothetical protein
MLRNAGVCLIRRPSVTSAAAELPGQVPNLKFGAYERVALFRLQNFQRASGAS